MHYSRPRGSNVGHLEMFGDVEMARHVEMCRMLRLSCPSVHLVSLVILQATEHDFTGVAIHDCIIKPVPLRITVV